MENEKGTRGDWTGMVSLLPNTWAKISTKYNHIKNIITDIQSVKYSGEIAKYRIAFIQHGKKSAITKKIKEGLPCFMWSGIFKGGKSDKHFRSHSQIISLDIDGLTPEGADEIKDSLLSSSLSISCLFIFLSPTLTKEIAGLKIGFAYDGSIPDKKTHKRCIGDLVDRLKAEKITPATDKAAYSLSRLCYMSYDPDAYYNDSAFDNALPVPPEEEKPEPTRMQIRHVDHTAGRKTPEPGMKKSDAELSEEFRLADLTEIQKKMEGVAVEGEKHYSRCEAGFFAGGSLAAGIITQSDMDSLTDTATANTTEKEIETWHTAVGEGEKAPLKTFDQRKADRVAWAKSKQQAELPKTDEEYHELFFNEIIKEIRVIMARDNDYQQAGTLAGEALRDGLIKQEDVDTLKESILENAFDDPDALGNFLSSLKKGKAGTRDPLKFEKMKTERLKAEGNEKSGHNASVEKAQAKLEKYFEHYNKHHALIKAPGGKAKVLNHIENQVFGTPDIDFSSLSDFKALQARDVVYLPTPDPETKSKKVYAAKAWLESDSCLIYPKGLTFDPSGNETPGFFNLWRGFTVKPKKGDWSLMEEHIYSVICNGNEEHYQWLWAWLCDIFQNPEYDQKKGSSVILRGKQRIGKNAFSDYIDSLLGASGMTVTNPAHVTGKFNFHLRNIIFLVANEAFLAHGITAHSALKNIITEKVVMCEQKGIDALMMRNYVRVMMLSNRDKVIHADLDESRFFVLDVSDKYKGNLEYFGKLHDQMANGGLEAFLYDLLNDQIDQDINLRKPPRTDGLFDQIADTDDPFLSWLIDKLEDRQRTWNLSLIERPGELLTNLNRYIENMPNCKGIGLTSRGFGKRLSNILDVKRVQANSEHMASKDGLERKEWIYVLPNLFDAKKQFEEAFGGEIAWPQYNEVEEPSI